MPLSVDLAGYFASSRKRGFVRPARMGRSRSHVRAPAAGLLRTVSRSAAGTAVAIGHLGDSQPGSGGPSKHRGGLEQPAAQRGRRRMRSGPERWLLLVWTSGWVMHSARSALAAVASLSLPKLLKMFEAYWAAITTIVVMQSSLGSTWPTSIERFAGTALGCAFGAAVASVLASNWLVYGGGDLRARTDLRGAPSQSIGVSVRGADVHDRRPPDSPGRPGRGRVRRFLEVSLGIAVALAMTALWPEREPAGS